MGFKERRFVTAGLAWGAKKAPVLGTRSTPKRYFRDEPRKGEPLTDVVAALGRAICVKVSRGIFAQELSNSDRILVSDVTGAGAVGFLGESFVAGEDDFKRADIPVLEFAFENVLGGLHKACFCVNIGIHSKGGEPR